MLAQGDVHVHSDTLDGVPIDYARTSSMDRTNSTGSLEFLVGLDDGMRLPSSGSIENFAHGNYSWGINSSLGFEWPSMQNFQPSSNLVQGQFHCQEQGQRQGQVKPEDSATKLPVLINNSQIYARSSQNDSPQLKSLQNPIDAIALANQHQHQLQLYQQHQLQQQYGTSVVPVESGIKKLDPSLPRNSSIDNFWLLVDIGDLPQPETNVLSERLFNVPEQAKSDMTNSSVQSAQISSPSSSSAAVLQNQVLTQNVPPTDVKLGENYQFQYNRLSHYNPYDKNDAVENASRSITPHQFETEMSSACWKLPNDGESIPLTVAELNERETGEDDHHVESLKRKSDCEAGADAGIDADVRDNDERKGEQSKISRVES
jgi:hypothetical protein